MKINRIVYMVIRRLYYVPYMIKEICVAGNGKKYTIEERYNKIRKVIKTVNKYGKVNIISSGQENLPKENGYILFPNHQGLFDVLLTVDTHERPVSIVMKKDLENIWFLKKVREALDGKNIDRDDVRQAMKVIKEMAEDVAEGRNYIIFAEGTRSRDGNNPGIFKGGTFKSAVKAKAPIVPVALIDAFKPFDEPGTGEVTVQIHYLKPLYYEEYKNLKTMEIADIVRSRIIEKIQSEKN